MTSAITALLNHIEQLNYDALPQRTIEATKTFILDSIGVGISGSRVSRVAQVKQAFEQAGQAKQAQVWATGEWLPAMHAAAVNAYQIHNQEWDCVHEAAVVHPMATILSSLMAVAQKEAVSGKQLILGVVIAVDVATLIGQSVTSSLKFFRPSICGSLGATAGICAMLGLKGKVLSNALGIAYSKLSGTMQAHTEGSPMLAMQIGFNAQSAVQSVDFARAGFEGPKDILEGPYGYFHLFEDSYDLTPFWAKLGREFQVECISHKPFPTGRAGHGTVDGLLSLKERYGFAVDEIDRVRVLAPPLVNRLVGREISSAMDANYAKLCNGYIAATALQTGGVTVAEFDELALKNSARLALAKKVSLSLNEEKNPNALAPIYVEVTLNNKDVFSIELPHVLGHPERPLSQRAQHEKFHAACASALFPFSTEKIAQLINGIDELPQILNINCLIELMINNKGKG